MLNTSAQWQAMAASGTAVLRCRLTLVGGGSFEYTDIDAPVISRALMGDGISVGNCVAACLTVTVKTDNSTTENLPRAAGLQLWAWWQAPDETICDAVCLGTFYVAHREYDARTRAMRLTCYDAMLKANAPYTVLNADWPCTMRWLAFAIARALGVVLDPRTTSALDNAPTALIPEPGEGTTLRDLLSQIAAVHGANWTVTQNKLRLKWIHQQGPADLVEYDPVPEGSDSDVISCRGVVGAVHYDVIPAQALGGRRFQITGLRLIQPDGTETLAGSDDGIVVPVNVPAWATAAHLNWLRAALLNVNYWWPAVLRGAVYDPAAELGDWIEYPVVYTEDGEERTSTGYCMLCAETITLGSLPRADIAMPEPGEAADEYPYLSKAARQSEQVQSRLTQLESAVPTLEDRVDTVEDTVDDLVTGVSGVKGNAESDYRTGNVNLTPANIGAVNKAGDTMTGGLTLPSIELKPDAGSGHGGFIDFHFNGSSADNTVRIMEISEGVLGVKKASDTRYYPIALGCKLEATYDGSTYGSNVPYIPITGRVPQYHSLWLARNTTRGGDYVARCTTVSGNPVFALEHTLFGNAPQSGDTIILMYFVM